jgi:hypothetical protein
MSTQQIVMLGTEMSPEKSVIWNQLTRRIDWENFIEFVLMAILMVR